jgi:muramoyltetrapeptide carboxypeptidase
MIAPPKLHPGDKVALLAPARWPAEQLTQALIDTLKRHGLVPVPHVQLQRRPGQLAGSDEVRANAFNDALRDPSIKAIFFPRAGSGSYRILDKIDYAAARQNPKIIIGFSDIDSLLSAISAHSGLITFRGPMGANFAAPDMDPRTESECFELLTGQRSEWQWNNATIITPGVAEGVIVGGNLATLNAQIGTPHDVDFTDKIVVLEEVDELLFRLDRFLYQAAPKLARARAVLFGTIENMLDGEYHDGSGTPFGEDLPHMLRRYVPACVPTAFGLPLGHGHYLSSHPIGAKVRVEIVQNSVKMNLLEAVVI